MLSVNQLINVREQGIWYQNWGTGAQVGGRLLSKNIENDEASSTAARGLAGIGDKMAGLATHLPTANLKKVMKILRIIKFSRKPHKWI